MLESQSKTANFSLPLPQLPEPQLPLLLQPFGTPFSVVPQLPHAILSIYFYPFLMNSNLYLLYILQEKLLKNLKTYDL
jgi:hypothetical protein